MNIQCCISFIGRKGPIEIAMPHACRLAGVVAGIVCILATSPAAQVDTGIRSVEEVRSRREERDRFDALRRACQRGETDKAVELIDELLEHDAPSLRIYGVLRSLSTRIDAEQLSTDLEDDAGQMPSVTNLLLLMSYSRQDTDRFERMKTNIEDNGWWDPEILRRIGRDAASLEDWVTARWAFVTLDQCGLLTDNARILSLARVFYNTGETDNALGMLDRLGDMARLPHTYADRSRILRARILFQRGDSNEALSILSSVRSRRSRERYESDLLSALYAFVAYDDSSARHGLVTAAGRVPDLPETNEALAFSSLSGKIPEGSHRRGVLRAMKYELQRRYDDAAALYLEIGEEMANHPGLLLMIRGARCLEYAGRPEDAITVWSELSANDEIGAVALLGLGDCLSSRGLSDSATVVYMELLTSFPESPHAARARNRILQ